MKTINKLFVGLIGLSSLYSCSDFDEVNTDPSKTPFESLKAYYTLNQSFSTMQMDPSTGERVFVYNWGEGARLVVEKGLLSVGGYDDDFISSFYYPCLSSAITTTNWSIKVTETTPKEEVDQKFYPNLKQFARIWRAYLLTQGADSFGPMPISQALDGTNPTYSSEKEVYRFVLSELGDAVKLIDTEVIPSATQKACDPYFEYNAERWIKYANSLRMRLAMRLSNLERKDPEMFGIAKAAFKEACADLSKTISQPEDIMEIVQNNGWNDYAGPYTRSYNQQALSSTMSNILTNLGGISVASQVPGNTELQKHIKDENYLGVKYSKHFVQNTDNPTKDYWMDGIPANLDPRALALYFIPGDKNAANYVNIGDAGYKDKTNQYGLVSFENEKDTIKIKNQYTWNGIPAGTSTLFSPSISKNELFASSTAIMNYYPILGAATRNATEKMVYFGPWETYFLIAEGLVRNWITAADVDNMTAEAAYNKGIELSFAHFGVEGYAEYINSEAYNRVGTSVKFSHTKPATTAQMKYIDGYTNEVKTITYEYPQGNKTIAEGGELNSELAKIMTQKYIAQMPYLVQECWSDFRRTGLPFFDMPANEQPMSGSTDMTEEYWTPDHYTTGQQWKHYPQRMRYPTKLNNANPTEYQHVLELLGGKDITMTPLWWSMGANK